MPISEKQKLQSYQYKAANIKRVPLDMQLTEYETVKQSASAAGQAVNAYIKQAIRERQARDAAPAGQPSNLEGGETNANE